MTIKQIETLLIKHLEESGEIRADLKWLKRAFWALATSGIGFNVGLATWIITRAWGR